MAWSFAAVVGGLLVILTLVTGNANGPDQRTRPTPWAAQFSATPSREPTPSAKPEIVDVATCTTAIPPEDIPELVSGMISGKLSDGESVTAVEFADRTISVAADLTGSDTTLSPDKLAELRFTSLTAPLVAPTSPTRTTIDTSWQCFYAQWGTVTVTFNGMSPVTMTKADLLDKEGGGYYFDPAKISAASKAAYIPPTTQAPEPTLTTPAPTTAPPPATDVYYKNCDEARAAGAAPIREGAPGYRPGLDRDKDGWACE
ncbi:MAG: excalibur calcium-binding domain-containing protein [Bifidobacteriaceae bacterium]|nr:excalibur calcium-binding domain-containing protein [Bifidobacteriaceae bacterium]